MPQISTRGFHLAAGWENRLLAVSRAGSPQNVLVLARFGSQLVLHGSESGLVGFVVAGVEFGNYDVSFDPLIRLAYGGEVQGSEQRNRYSHDAVFVQAFRSDCRQYL